MAKNYFNYKLFKNSIFNILNKLTNILFPVLTFPIVARIFGPEWVGKLEFSNSLVFYFILFSQIGIPIYGVKAFSKLTTFDNKRKFTIEILLISIVLTTLVIFLYFFVIFSFDFLLEFRTILLLNTFIILSSSLSFEWYFQAIQRFDYISIRTFIVKAAGLFSIFIFVNNNKDIYIYLGILVLSQFIPALINFFKMFNDLKLYKYKKSLNLIKHIKPLFVLFSFVLVGSIYANLDSLMIGLINNSEEVAFYATANRLIKIIIGLISSISVVLFPEISKLSDEIKQKKFKNFITDSIDLFLLLSIPLSIGVFITSKNIIFLFAGDLFFKAHIILQILSPLTIFLSLSNLIGVQIFVSKNMHKITFFSTLVGLVVNLTLNILLIPNFASVGAAIATIISEFIVLIVQIFFLKTLINLSKLFLKLFQYIFFSLPFFLIRYLLIFFNFNIWVDLSTTIVLCVVSYYFILLLFKNKFIKITFFQKF